MSKEDTEEMEEDGENEDEANEEEERIYYAITGEDIVTLKHLLEDGLDPNTKFHGSNQLDKSALHLCCETGNYECAKMLLEWGANINAMDAWSQTPLFYSISSERSNMVELLLQFHCDTDIKDRFGKTAAHFAINNSDTTNLCALVTAGASLNTKDDTGRAPLWDAVSEDGHNDHVKRLLAAGCDVNTKDHREKRTPLQVAILNANHDAVPYVRQLLDAGALCNTIDQFGHSPMMTLIRRNRRKDKEHVQEEDLTIAQMLIAHNYNVDLVSRGRHWYQFRGTALKMAADRGAVPLVQLLLDASADPDIADDKNVTPLLVAASNNYLDVVKQLLLTNCRVNTLGEIKIDRTSLTLTPFKCALLKGYLDMAKLLVLAGYNLHHEEYLWSNKDVPGVLVENVEFWSWVQEQVNVPWSLAIQSRIRIRELLGKPLKQRLEQLPLPRAIKDYVLLKDLLRS